MNQKTANKKRDNCQDNASESSAWQKSLNSEKSRLFGKHVNIGMEWEGLFNFRRLLTAQPLGNAGTGKTYLIKAIWCRFQEMVKEDFWANII